MLAYSSVEHMGIIALGIGFGGVFGIFGAILHMFNHAMTKSLMFFGAGNVLLKHETKEMDKVSGIVKSMPATGTMLLIGGLAITGSPLSVYSSANLPYFLQDSFRAYNSVSPISPIYNNDFRRFFQ